MKLGNHEGSVQHIENNKFRGVCNGCGWHSNTKQTYSDAETALHNHIERHTLHGDEGGKKL